MVMQEQVCSHESLQDLTTPPECLLFDAAPIALHRVSKTDQGEFGKCETGTMPPFPPAVMVLHRIAQCATDRGFFKVKDRHDAA